MGPALVTMRDPQAEKGWAQEERGPAQGEAGGEAGGRQGALGGRRPLDFGLEVNGAATWKRDCSGE